MYSLLSKVVGRSSLPFPYSLCGTNRNETIYQTGASSNIYICFLYFYFSWFETFKNHTMWIFQDLGSIKNEYWSTKTWIHHEHICNRLIDFLDRPYWAVYQNRNSPLKQGRPKSQLALYVVSRFDENILAKLRYLVSFFCIASAMINDSSSQRWPKKVELDLYNDTQDHYSYRPLLSWAASNHWLALLPIKRHYPCDSWHIT